MIENQDSSSVSLNRQAIRQHSQYLQHTVSHSTTIILLICSFYFMLFGIVELVTNSAQVYYSFPLNCSSLSCQVNTSYISFNSDQQITIYLQVPKLTQMDYMIQLELKNDNYLQCDKKWTNKMMHKSINILGTRLENNNNAIPCNIYLMHYPQGQLNIKNLNSSQFIQITNEIQPEQQDFLISNTRNLSKQWANFSTNRFMTWIKSDIQLTLVKLWGHILNQHISGVYHVNLSFNNIVTQPWNNSKILITNNAALAGYNLYLCIIMFVFMIIILLSAFLSFRLEHSKKSSKEIQSQNQSDA